MPSLPLPLTCSALPLHSVDLSPPSLPTSSLTLPLPWSILPSVLSCTCCLLVVVTGLQGGKSGAGGGPGPLPIRHTLTRGSARFCGRRAMNDGAHQFAL